MKWPDVIHAIMQTLVADPILAPIYGEAVRLRGPSGTVSAEARVPTLDLWLIADAVDELWAPCTIQFDQWTRDELVLVRSERRLRRLLHQDLPITLAGVTFWSQYVDGEILALPDRDGFFGRALRFRCTPLRDRYAPGTFATS